MSGDLEKSSCIEDFGPIFVVATSFVGDSSCDLSGVQTGVSNCSKFSDAMLAALDDLLESF